MKTSAKFSKAQIIQAIKRELARRHFWDFCLYYDYAFFSKRPFLKVIADAFERIFSGLILKLSVSMPPRAGKSYITSLFAAWFLAKRPELSVMRNTCTATLYDKFSYDTRAIIRSEKFREVFPEVELAEDRQNISGWNLKTSRQVGYFGAGVGGTIIGFGCSGIAITDDLYKSMEDAMSEGTNEKVKRWKESAHDSRLEKNCPTIDIGTRWTKNDIIGKGIEEKKYDESIVIPALIEERSFCEEVKTTEEYLKIRKEIIQEIWDAEYMQEPAEIKGLLFNKKDLKRFSLKDFNLEGLESTLGYCDVKDEGDDMLSCPFARIFPGKVFITDVVYSSDTVEITVPEVAAKMEELQANYVRVEKNNQGGGFIRDLRRLIAPEKILTVHSSQNKNVRIWNEYGFIIKYFYFKEESEIEPGSPYDRFMRNFMAYMKNGTSKHDDAPDSAAGLSKFIQSYLPNLFAPVVVKPEEKPETQPEE